MVVIRGAYQVPELFFSLFGCLGLHLVSYNVLPFWYNPELPSALFIFSTVILLNYLRVRYLTPVKDIFQFFIELIVIYACCQFASLLLWENFCVILELIRNRALSTRYALTILRDTPRVFLFIRQDVFYILKASIACGLTYGLVKLTKSMDYFLPGRRNYHYFYDSANRIDVNLIDADDRDRLRALGNFSFPMDLPEIPMPIPVNQNVRVNRRTAGRR